MKAAPPQRTKANAVSAARVTVMAATAVNATVKTGKTRQVMTRQRRLAPARMPRLRRLLPQKPLAKIAPHNAHTLSGRNKPLPRPHP